VRHFVRDFVKGNVDGSATHLCLAPSEGAIERSRVSSMIKRECESRQ
jgi:hypothetical protein